MNGRAARYWVLPGPAGYISRDVQTRGQAGKDEAPLRLPHSPLLCGPAGRHLQPQQAAPRLARLPPRQQAAVLQRAEETGGLAFLPAETGPGQGKEADGLAVLSAVWPSRSGQAGAPPALLSSGPAGPPVW